MKNLKILIADNHQMFREGLESLLLQKVSYIKRLRQASNGGDVISMLAKEEVDIVFMDIHMPVMDGIEATKEVVKLYPETKVISVTMLEDRKSIVNMFNAGAAGYILKNTSFKEIEEAIYKVMNGEKYYNKNISDILLDKTFDIKKSFKRDPNKEELTTREREVTTLICKSFTSKEIGEILFVSEKTVETHRTNIYSKLGIDNIVDLVFYALDHGIVTRD